MLNDIQKAQVKSIQGQAMQPVVLVSIFVFRSLLCCHNSCSVVHAQIIELDDTVDICGRTYAWTNIPNTIAPVANFAGRSHGRSAKALTATTRKW